MIDTDVLIAEAASNVYRRFYKFVERDEMLAEGYVWTLGHPERVASYQEDEKPSRAEYRFRRDVMIAMESYARGEKASIAGYDRSDELFYSEALIASLLPQIVTDQYEAPSGPADGVRATTDPAEGGTWMSARADVAQAWATTDLDETERAMMINYYVLGYTQDEIADGYPDLAQSQVSRILSKGMRKMINALGGPALKGCPYDCNCHDAALRRRPGLHSNDSGMNQMGA